MQLGISLPIVTASQSESQFFTEITLNFQAVSNDISTFGKDFTDSTLTYVISNSAIWKFDSSGKYIFYANLFSSTISEKYTHTKIESLCLLTQAPMLRLLLFLMKTAA